MRCHAASERCTAILIADHFNEIGFSVLPVLGLLYTSERGTMIICSIGGYLAVAMANNPRRLEPLSAPHRELKILRFEGKTPTADFSVAECNFPPCKQRSPCKKRVAHKLAKFSTATALIVFRRIKIFLCAYPPRYRKQSKELGARFGVITLLSLHTYIHLSL